MEDKPMTLTEFGLVLLAIATKLNDTLKDPTVTPNPLVVTVAALAEGIKLCNPAVTAEPEAPEEPQRRPDYAPGDAEWRTVDYNIVGYEIQIDINNAGGHWRHRDLRMPPHLQSWVHGRPAGLPVPLSTDEKPAVCWRSSGRMGISSAWEEQIDGQGNYRHRLASTNDLWNEGAAPSNRFDGTGW